MEQLDGAVAVVTGAASGIGRALAPRFAHEGMKVVLADSERNRPADVPATDADPQRRAIRAQLEAEIATSSMDPAEIADQVVEAIRAPSFVVLTHPEPAFGAVEASLRWMHTGEPPQARRETPSAEVGA